MAAGGEVVFGIDAFAPDDRMRQFRFLAADKRTTYLRLLRPVNRAGANYLVLPHANPRPLDPPPLTRRFMLAPHSWQHRGGRER